MTYPPNIVNSADSLPQNLQNRSLAPAEYYLSVDGTVYGPYSYALMQQYVGESRVVPQSLLSTHANAGFKAASLWPEYRAWSEAHSADAKSEAPPLPSVFIVIVDIESGHYMEFMKSLQPLGKAYRLSKNVWILSAPASADYIRDALSVILTAEDRLFIHDSFSNRAGWFNIGDSLDKNIRDLWTETAKNRRRLKNTTP